MSAAALMREAKASGIELRLVGGKVKAIGPREAVARLLVPLREHKAALVNALREVAVDAIDWRALDVAYTMHHFNCPTCIAAGRGARYGLRCGVGMALWRAYSMRRLSISKPLTTKKRAATISPLQLPVQLDPFALFLTDRGALQAALSVVLKSLLHQRISKWYSVSWPPRLTTLFPNLSRLCP